MNNTDMFFLSPKNRDRLVRIMEGLEKQGFSTNNQVLTVVLRVMREKGVLPQADDKDIINIIKKVIPEGGKILCIRGGDNG